jgi:hypothetical protein
MARKMSQQTTAGARTSTQKGAELPFWGQAGVYASRPSRARESDLIARELLLRSPRRAKQPRLHRRTELRVLVEPPGGGDALPRPRDRLHLVGHADRVEEDQRARRGRYLLEVVAGRRAERRRQRQRTAGASARASAGVCTREARV